MTTWVDTRELRKRLGRAVMDWRLQRKLSLKALSRRAGCISDRYLSDLECGTANPTIEVYETLFAALGINPLALLDQSLEGARLLMIEKTNHAASELHHCAEALKERVTALEKLAPLPPVPLVDIVARSPAIPDDVIVIRSFKKRRPMPHGARRPVRRGV